MSVKKRKDESTSYKKNAVQDLKHNLNNHCVGSNK